MNGAAGVTIARLIDLPDAAADRPRIVAAIGRIFRDAAASWPDDPERARKFQYLWLDQYLVHEPELVFVAVADGAVVGYLVGCRVDPSTSPRFAELGYFRDFAALCGRYPAHLHVNLDAAWRQRRIGEQLVEGLCARLEGEGIPGVHVVTGSAQRNVGFYKRLGFHALARAPRGAGEVSFLGRKLRA